MVALTYPGVYVQEISSGVRPIGIASTSTAAFVGLAEMGPDAPTLVTNWTEFQKFFGSFISDGYLAHSVFQYFNNGGRQCYIVRVTRSDATAASVTVQNRATPPVAALTFSARNKGAWGNSIYLQIEDGANDPGNTFKISVRRQDDPNVVPANFADLPPLEVFDNLVVDPNSPNHVFSVLAQQSTLISAQVLAADTTQHGVHRGGFNPSLPLNTKNSFQINIDNDGLQLVALPNTATASTTLADVAAAIQAAVAALTPKKASTPPAAFTAFTCAVDTVSAQSRLVLQSGSSTAASSVQVLAATANDASALLKLGTANGGVSEGALALRRPANASVIQVGDNAVTAPVTAVAPGK